ncbi:hypothetical protein [Bradyrhizobium sp. th.b2]|uniref:hypothetical protein n=1 Tax=Bradyrhizobium sp. th-b2 TaxID=172088 RepID=UPI00041A6D9A|nr:hypothetical protein [Bradyrhizobium sp. th.b2]
MFAIGLPPGKKLPFATLVVGQHTFPHMHRDRAGFTWTENITLAVHVLGIRPYVDRPRNDNKEAA